MVGWLASHHQLYSSVGADIVMESISLIDPVVSVKVRYDRNDQDPAWLFLPPRRTQTPPKGAAESGQEGFRQWWSPISICQESSKMVR